MKSYLILFSILFLLTTNALLFAQEPKEEQEPESFKRHKLAIAIGHTRVPKAFQSSTGSQTVIVPSWGFNYDYSINKSWTIGIHTDMEIATYLIERDTGTKLERENPIIISIVGSYKPWRELVVGVGFGKEFESHENFWVYRFGAEYEIELPHSWSLTPSLVFDIKEDLYDSWTMGLGVGRRF